MCFEAEERRQERLAGTRGLTCPVKELGLRAFNQGSPF